MILAIDAGNSRTKWGVFDTDDKLIANGALDNSELQSLTQPLPAWLDCERIAISNVAGPALSENISALLKPLAIPMRTITAQAAACGVKNAYINPELLGSDRWAALIAAWNHYRQPCIVATAGTALTVDALSGSGDFLGGLIVPGYRLMRQSLALTSTALDQQRGALQDFPKSTADALHSGALRALAGAVHGMCTLLRQHEGGEPLCILSGGDAAMLSGELHRPCEIVDNLVLQGLLLIERELGVP
jgi:type III pantothenate kinase